MFADKTEPNPLLAENIITTRVMEYIDASAVMLHFLSQVQNLILEPAGQAIMIL